jgi:hypothetical protein
MVELNEQIYHTNLVVTTAQFQCFRANRICKGAKGREISLYQ